MYVKRGLITTLLAAALLCGGGAASAATTPNSESFKVLCDGTNKLPPIYVAYTRDGAFERFNIVRDEKTGQLRGGYVPVAQEHIDSICAKGQAISAAPKPLSAEGEGTKVYTSYTLPSSFTIATYYGVIFGNFWVPGVMPSGHAAHLASYDFQGYNFRNSTGGSHFVNSMITQANWTTNHTGMGMIFGGGMAGTGTSGGLTCYPFSAVTESWHSITSPSNIVWRAGYTPNTCSPDFYADNVAFSVLSGANILQRSTFHLFYYGNPTAIHEAPVVDSAGWPFQPGYAGVAFLVATAVTSLPVSEYWTLSFTNVYHWTQP